MPEINYDDRIVFDPELQIMEVDFSELTFDRSKPVNAFYDEAEARLAETGKKWFFLVNYRDTTIMTEAWIAFAHRGKKINLAYSLGSARYSASDDTGETIMERSKKENFDPNLFDSRKAAVTHLMALRIQIPKDEYEKSVTKAPDEPKLPVSDRIIFHDEINVMEVDFSDYTFANSGNVKQFYETIGEKLEETGQKWYFLVNYNQTEILPDAWYQWSISSKRLNAAFSLGTVRFNAKAGTRENIQKRANAEHADANLVASRAEALSRIVAMKNTEK